MAKEDLDLDVEAAAPAKKSGALKWIVIGVLAVTLLGGAIFGVLYFSGVIGGDDESEAVAGDEAAAATAESADKGDKAGKAAKAPLIYLPMEPPFVVNFPATSDVRFMQITLQVAARDQAVIDRIKEHTPAIRNGLVLLFSDQDPAALNTREGKATLLGQCLDEVNRVLKEQTGSAGVENVYFTSFVMQ